MHRSRLTSVLVGVLYTASGDGVSGDRNRMLPFNFNHLYYFYVVARRGSFSEAARELRVSQSSISIQIKQFEASMGHTLFDRLKGGVRLTEPGQVVFQYAEEVFHDVGRVRSELEAIEHHIRGRIAVGTVNSIGIYLLPDVLKSFNEQYADVKIAIDFDLPRELVERLREGRLDFVILTSNRRHDGLTSVPLRKEKMFLVAPRGHPLLAQDPPSPRDLERYLFIGYEEGMESRAMVDALFRRMTIAIEYAMESSNVATIKHMVMAGLGLAILPENVVGDEIRRGLLVRPAMPSLYMVQEITLYYKTSRSLTPTRARFMNVVRELFGRERRTKR